MDELVKCGWLEWNITRDTADKKTKTLLDLTRHLRNAAAHGRFRFGGNSDSRYLSEVVLIVEDKPQGVREPNWRAEIEGSKQYEFCVLLAHRMEESIGNEPPADTAGS